MKEGLKGNKTLNATERESYRLVENCLMQFDNLKFYFQNNIKSSKPPISINFSYSLRNSIYPQTNPKIAKKTAQKVDMWHEQRLTA